LQETASQAMICRLARPVHSAKGSLAEEKTAKTKKKEKEMRVSADLFAKKAKRRKGDNRKRNTAPEEA